MQSRTEAILVLMAALATVPLLVGTTFPGFTFLIVPIFALTVGLGYGAARVHAREPWLLPALIGFGVVIAVVSVVTGALNGLSDEPYSTPAYASLGLQMYSRSVTISYDQYGTFHTETVYNVYLPLLTYLQVPGLDYRWVSLTAWAGTLYLLRRNPMAQAGYSATWIPLLAANGQNDFVPLFAVTLALVVPLGVYGWFGEAFALALKQWANVVVFFYHLARGDALRALASVAITVGILAPFLYVNPSGVWCHVIVGNSGTTCNSNPWTFFVFKRNYWLYPSWVAVVYFTPIWRSSRSLVERFRGRGAAGLMGAVRPPRPPE
jgi:hypothetical protein